MEQKISKKIKINLQKNQIYTQKVIDFGSNGEGIVKINNITVFVPYAIVGEVIELVIVLVKSSYAIGKLLKVVEPSQSRITAPCPYFGKCGGCQLQHMDYDSQLKFKQKLVQNSLKKYAGYAGDVQSVVASPNIYNYRNKFAMPVAEDNGDIVVGMYRTASHKLVPITDCLISQNCKIILQVFTKFAKTAGLKAYSSSNPGGVRHLMCRSSGDNVLLTIVSGAEIKNLQPLFASLNKYFINLQITNNINTVDNNVILGAKDIVKFGTGQLAVDEYNLNYSVNCHSFMQVNTPVKHLIYNRVLQEISSADMVVDAYSGAGVLSGIIAAKCRYCYGIEIVKEASRDAETLKSNNKIANLTNICGDCSQELPKICKKLKDFVLVLDPPRKGCDPKVISTILSCCPSKIIYISCNPATLARDVALLASKYKVNFVQPYDMFPQTANVETLVILTKIDNYH